MRPEDAVLAAKLLRTKTVVPIHYNTIPCMPLIQQYPEAFASRLPEGVIQIMSVGDVIEL